MEDPIAEEPVVDEANFPMESIELWEQEDSEDANWEEVSEEASSSYYNSS